jgi:hypothetical protein
VGGHVDRGARGDVVRITEILMRPGGWQMSLRPDTPQSVADAVRDALATYDSTNERWTSVMDGQIVVFDTDVATPSLARARYTGILEAQTDALSFSGPGLAALLATDDGIGFTYSPTTGSTTSVQSLLEAIDVFDFDGGNGLTAGTDFAAAGATSAVDDGTPSPMTARERIDGFAKIYDQEWRVNPDGTIDAGAPDDGLFVTTPTVLVDAKPGGQFGSIRRINGTATSAVIDGSQVTSRTVAYPANASSPGTASAAGTVARGLDGAAWKRYRVIDAPEENEENGTAADLAQSTQNLFEYPRSSFSVTSGDAHVRRFVEPGDTVYVYFPEGGIKSTNVVSVGAQTVRPQKVRVHEIDWGVHEGHGVWLRRHNGSTETWLRLTPYVQFADSTSAWKVGTARGVLDNVALSGGVRLGTDEVGNLLYVDPPQSSLPNESPHNPIPHGGINAPAVIAPTYAPPIRMSEE